MREHMPNKGILGISIISFVLIPSKLFILRIRGSYIFNLARWILGYSHHNKIINLATFNDPYCDYVCIYQVKVFLTSNT